MGVVEPSRRVLLLKKHKSIVETRRHQEALVQTSRNVVTGSTDILNNRKSSLVFKPKWQFTT